MVVVHVFQERLDLAALRQTLFAHSSVDLHRGSLNTGDQSVREFLAVSALVVLVDDDGFLACLSAGEDDADSAWLHEFSHICLIIIIVHSIQNNFN